MFEIRMFNFSREVVKVADISCLSDAVWSYYDYLRSCKNFEGTLYSDIELGLYCCDDEYKDKPLIYAFNDSNKLIVRDDFLYEFYEVYKNEKPK